MRFVIAISAKPRARGVLLSGKAGEAEGRALDMWTIVRQAPPHMRKEELVRALSHGNSKASANPAASSKTGPDAVTLLTNDHKKVKALFNSALEKERGDESLRDLAGQIIAELGLDLTRFGGHPVKPVEDGRRSVRAKIETETKQRADIHA